MRSHVDMSSCFPPHLWSVYHLLHFQLINVHSSSSFSIGSCPPRVNDVSWRLQHHIKVFFLAQERFFFLSVRQSKKCCLPWQNAHLDRVNEPFYTISLKTEVKLESFVISLCALVAFFFIPDDWFTLPRIKDPWKTLTSPALWSSFR